MNLNTFLYCLLGTLSLYITTVNVQTDNIQLKRRMFIFIYILLVSTVLIPCIGQSTTLLTLIGIIILLSWKQSYKTCNIISFLLGYLILVCLDYFISTIAFSNFYLFIQDIQQHYLLFLGTINLLFLFILTKLLGWFLHKKIKIQALMFPKKLTFCVLGSLCVCVIIFVLGINWREKIGYPPNVVILNNSLFFFYCILMVVSFFILYHTLKKNKLLKMKLIQYENLETYTNEIEHAYMDMRSFKHDYVDILTSLKCYIDSNNMDALSNYFNNNILTLSHSFKKTDHKLGLLSNLKIDALKSIISSKLLFAIEKGLLIDIEIVEPIHNISMDIIDLIRIISIFLNNAIEAALLSTEKKLRLAIIDSTDSIIIILINSSIPLSVPIERLYDYGYSTKGMHRGIGINNAQKILETYTNLIWDMTYTDCTFTQQLTIFNQA